MNILYIYMIQILIFSNSNNNHKFIILIIIIIIKILSKIQTLNCQITESYNCTKLSDPRHYILFLQSNTINSSL